MPGNIDEDALALLCKRIKEKIEAYPEAAEALKELGRDLLRSHLRYMPEWSLEYNELFK